MRPLIIIGGGGHAAVCEDLAVSVGREILMVLADRAQERELKTIAQESVELVNGVGSIGTRASREAHCDVYQRFTGVGYTFATLIHPSAIIAANCQMGCGTVVMAGAVIQAQVSIAANCIVNTGVLIDHHCAIGAHVHVAPGAVLSGSVTIGEGVHVGANATVIQDLHIAAGAVIGAGATVISSVPENCTVVGTPAREKE